MRRARVVIALPCAVVFGLIAAHGCQDPTQVTLEISLAQRAQCSEIPHGTAVTVGVEPKDVEERVASGFVNAKTTDCDPNTRRIGTLVITPADPERASVIVVVGYRRDPAECKPPLYKDCIVARRRWSFSKHRPLRMPITIDPKCADVPCDAFSTCRDGLCFESVVDTDGCEGDGCIEPGATADGGTNVDAALPDEGGIPDAPAPIDGPPIIDAPTDGPGDGGLSDAGPFVPYCTGGLNTLHCLSTGIDVACSNQLCCDVQGAPYTCNTGGAPCTQYRYCCVDTDCAPYQFCPGHPPNLAGICQTKNDGGSVDAGDGGGRLPPFCVLNMPQPDDLKCWVGTNVNTCTPPSECCDSNSPASCPPQGNCIGQSYCCTAANCSNGGSCPRSMVEINAGVAGRCVGGGNDAGGPAEPYCELNGELRCGGVSACNLTMNCCDNTCQPGACGGTVERCCKDADCASNVCNGKGIQVLPDKLAAGFCQIGAE